MNFDLSPFVERFNNLDTKIRYAVFAVCLLGIAGIDYVLLLRVQLNGLRAMDVQAQTLKADIARVKTDVQHINQIKQDLESFRSQLEGVNSKIRSLQEVPLLLEDISRIAQESNVAIEQIIPLKEGQEPLVTAADVKYYSLPIVIVARSGYHMFGYFLRKLESSDLLFTVHELRIGRESLQGLNGLSIRTTLKVVLADRSAELKK